MAIGADEAAKMKCPLCDNPLARGDYEKARTRLAAEAGTRADAQLKAALAKHERELSEMRAQHEREVESRKSAHEDQVESVRKEMSEMLSERQQRLTAEHKKEIREEQKRHKQAEARALRDAGAEAKSLKLRIGRLEREKMASRSSAERKLRKQHEREIAGLKKRLDQDARYAAKRHSDEIRGRDKELRGLKKQVADSRAAAEASARESLGVELDSKNQQIREKDVQIRRAKDKIAELSKQLEQRQPELAGEAGEENLLQSLRRAFPDDTFRSQKRGESSSDLIQHIREGGIRPDTPIVYDNKASAAITRRDIAKAKKYRDTHDTEYSLIVSSSLPKSSPSRLLGSDDGVMLVHPSIVTEVAATLRRGIIAIHKASESQHDRSTKEARLYEYVTGREFQDTVASLQASREELESLQTREEKQHGAIWTARKNLVEGLRKTEIGISGKVYGIVQGEAEFEQAPVAR